MSAAENQDQVIIKPLTGAGGAAVWGLDITKMDDAGYGQVNDLMLQYGALAIHGQADASVDDLRSFGLHYGELDIHGYSPTVEGFDDVMTIGQLRGGHSIRTFHGKRCRRNIPCCLPVRCQRWVAGHSMLTSTKPMKACRIP